MISVRALHSLALAFILLASGSVLLLNGQVQSRVWLSDKGTAAGDLQPGDPLYDEATAHLTDLALQRRQKVLSPDRLVSTRDLPIRTEYMDGVVGTGASVLQKSRWFNTLLVVADSSQRAEIRNLPYVDSVQDLTVTIAGKRGTRSKPLSEVVTSAHTPHPSSFGTSCVTMQYGESASQLERIGVDHAHRIGISGEGVFVGIIDAGFDWRGHTTLRNAEVVAEYDFVNKDSNTADEPGQPASRFHGTLVMSVIGSDLPGRLMGVAPDARFALAKSEDVTTETPVEEDNFVAALEWLESLGVDITSTSLGYTTFDPPYRAHGDHDMDGRTPFASRGVNRATALGVLCIQSAGNEFRGFRRVSVPAEADSAIAVAALDLNDSVASFSSQGTGDPGRIKPDVAAPGVRIYSADANDSAAIFAVQGTSLAAPLTTGIATLLLSADRSLTPWQLRDLLRSGAANNAQPDTLVGSGRVSAAKSLHLMAKNKGVAGAPLLHAAAGSLALSQWVTDGSSDEVDMVDISSRYIKRTASIRNLRTGLSLTSTAPQPQSGTNNWFFADWETRLGVLAGDSLELQTEISPTIVVRHVLLAVVNGPFGSSRFCLKPPAPKVSLLTSRPNPMIEGARVEFLLTTGARASLSLFNDNGEEVMTVVRERDLDAGFHSFLVDPHGLPSGAYFYRLMVGSELYSWSVVRLR